MGFEIKVTHSVSIFQICSLYINTGLLIIAFLTFVAIAIASWVAVRSFLLENKHKRSNVSLVGIEKSCQRIKEILMPDEKLTNDRVRWVAAARMATRTLSLIENIEEEHQTILAISLDGMRIGIEPFFSHPVEHYFGLESIDTSKDSFSPEEIYSLWVKGMEEGKSYISEDLLIPIYKLFWFGTNYDDPLDGTRQFTDEEIKQLEVSFRAHKLGEVYCMPVDNMPNQLSSYIEFFRLLGAGHFGKEIRGQ